MLRANVHRQSVRSAEKWPCPASPPQARPPVHRREHPELRFPDSASAVRGTSAARTASRVFQDGAGNRDRRTSGTLHPNASSRLRICSIDQPCQHRQIRPTLLQHFLRDGIALLRGGHHQRSQPRKFRRGIGIGEFDQIADRLQIPESSAPSPASASAAADRSRETHAAELRVPENDPTPDPQALVPIRRR